MAGVNVEEVGIVVSQIHLITIVNTYAPSGERVKILKDGVWKFLKEQTKIIHFIEVGDSTKKEPVPGG